MSEDYQSLIYDGSGADSAQNFRRDMIMGQFVRRAEQAEARIEIITAERDDLAKKLEKVKVLMALGFAENERRLAVAEKALEHAKLNMPHPDQMIDDALAALKGDTDMADKPIIDRAQKG